MSIFINGNTTNVGSGIPTIYTSITSSSTKTHRITFDVIGEPKVFFVLHNPSSSGGSVLYTTDIMSIYYDGVNKQLVNTYQGGFGQMTMQSTTSFTYTYDSSTNKFTVNSANYYFENNSYKLIYIC